MSFLKNKFVQIGIAILIGVLVHSLPRPQGNTFEVSGDPERQLAAAAASAFDIIEFKGRSETYRLEATESIAAPGTLITERATELGAEIEVRYINGLSPKAFRFLAVLAALIFLFVVEPIPLEITAILIGVLLVGFRIVDLTSAWATYMPKRPRPRKTRCHYPLGPGP